MNAPAGAEGVQSLAGRHIPELFLQTRLLSFQFREPGLQSHRHILRRAPGSLLQRGQSPRLLLRSLNHLAELGSLALGHLLKGGNCQLDLLLLAVDLLLHFTCALPQQLFAGCSPTPQLFV